MERILGIDYGERRMGTALGDTLSGMAMPLVTVPVDSDATAVAAVVALCREHGIGRIVVGLPLNMNGSRGEMVERVERFLTLLRGLVTVPVETCDERLSSGLVERVLLEADMSRSRRKEVRDKLAAQVILQGYLDAAATRAENDLFDLEPGDEA